MNRAGINNLPISFQENNDDSERTDEEADWREHYENDMYMHSLLNFVDHVNKQRKKASTNPTPWYTPTYRPFARPPPTKKQPRRFATFFKWNKTQVPSVVYVVHETTNQTSSVGAPPSGSCEIVKTTEELTKIPVNTLAPSPILPPSCSKDPFGITVKQLSDNGIVMMKQKSHCLRRDDASNVSYFANKTLYPIPEEGSSVCFMQYGEQLTDGSCVAWQFVESGNRPHHRRSGVVLCGVEQDVYGANLIG
jgi:hypothetical protein